MNEAQVRALIAAGRLLQAKTWPSGRVKIEKREGEGYPQAVSRVIATLDDGDRDLLRELVAWVLEYEHSECQADKNIRVPSSDLEKSVARDSSVKSN